MDIGAALAIRQQIIALSDSGVGVLIVSEDLAELFEICDRIAVLSAGRLSQPRAAAQTTMDEVGLLMGGMHAEPMRETAHAA